MAILYGFAARCLFDVVFLQKCSVDVIDSRQFREDSARLFYPYRPHLTYWIDSLQEDATTPFSWAFKDVAFHDHLHNANIDQKVAAIVYRKVSLTSSPFVSPVPVPALLFKPYSISQVTPTNIQQLGGSVVDCINRVFIQSNR